MTDAPADAPARHEEEDDRWLDIYEAAKYLGFNPQWVRVLCRTGKMHFQRGGDGPKSPFRLKKWYLDAYLQGKTAVEVAGEERRREREAGLWTGTRRRGPRRTASAPDRVAL